MSFISETKVQAEVLSVARVSRASSHQLEVCFYEVEEEKA